MAYSIENVYISVTYVLRTTEAKPTKPTTTIHPAS